MRSMLPDAGSLIQVKVAQRAIRERSLLGLLDGLGELLREHVVLVLFRVDGLAEQALATLVALTVRTRGLAEVLERLLAGRRRVRNDGTRNRIDLEDRSAVRATYFKGLVAESHGRLPQSLILKGCGD
jgi:hypothetical protein